MPYRKRLQIAATESPQKLLTVWREERSQRIGKTLCWGGLILSAFASVADFVWSSLPVFATDLVLFFCCLLSIFWLRKPNRPVHYWWPIYFAFWLSILPSLWQTGGLNSPFFALDLVLLVMIGIVMETRNNSLLYIGFAALHVPVFYVLELFFPLSAAPVPPVSLSVVIIGVTLAAVFICVHALLRTERELSMEFAEHYRNLGRTEQELKKSESQLREAQSIARIGSWDWDIKADVVSWSDELHRIFDIKKENFDPSFEGYLKRIHPEMRDYIQGVIQNSFHSGQDFAFETKLQSDEGERFIFSRGRVMKDPNGMTIQMRGTCQDVTDRKRIESELVHARDELEKRVQERTLQLAQSLEREKQAKEMAQTASQAKMQFLANMSHEIRTPMNSILGFSDLMTADTTSAEEGREYLARIRANGTQLLHLIDDILDLSKFEAGRIPIHKTSFYLEPVVESVVSSFQPLLATKGLELTVGYEGDASRPFFTDTHRLSQILINLLNNAIKFSERGSVRVRIELEKPTSVDAKSVLLKVDVEDSGIGISEQNQKGLFEPFRQGDPSIARKFGGSGLGLSLSKRIAEALGGRLELKKSAPGVGSHFFFQIPLELATEEIHPTKSTKAAAGDSKQDKPFHDKKILLVEDSPDNAFLICRYLGPLGAGIDVASDGLQAVKMAGKQNYDCILMDIQMPGMDGLEATRRIRGQGYSRPIIALTAHALPAETARSMEAGCNLHLTKPINKSELISNLSEQLKL